MKLTCEIEETLERLIPLEGPLYEAARYSLLAPAKRLRPRITLAIAKDALVPACTLELVHTYSLIHDDLPAMDNDDLRRGKPTLHKAYPEWHAILTGDYLLTYAFEILATSEGLNNAQRVRLIECLAKRCGGEGMIGGQMLDLGLEQHDMTSSLLRELHLKKTAGLLIAAFEFGAICASLSPAIERQLKICGEHLGLAFQIQDDILDITSSTDVLGKPIGSDSDKKRPTSVAVLGLKKAQEMAALHFETAYRSLPEEMETLKELIELIETRKM